MDKIVKSLGGLVSISTRAVATWVLVLAGSTAMSNALAHDPGVESNHSGTTLINRVLDGSSARLEVKWGDMVLDAAGNPVIAYVTSEDRLYLVRCNDQDCLGGDDLIKRIAFNASGRPSIGLTFRNEPVIAYSHQSKVYLATCHDSQCNSMGDPLNWPTYLPPPIVDGEPEIGVPAIIDENASAGTNIDLVMGEIAYLSDGTPIRQLVHIAYHDQNSGDVRYIKCPPNSCDDIAINYRVIDYNVTGGGLSLARGSGGRVGLIYNLEDRIRIKIWDERFVIGSPFSAAMELEPKSKYGSLAFDSQNHPLVTYVWGDLGSDPELSVRLLRCGDESCSASGNVTREIDVFPYLGILGPVDLAINRNDNPVMAYKFLEQVRYVSCDTPTCSEGAGNVVHGVVFKPDATVTETTDGGSADINDFDLRYFGPEFLDSPSFDLGYYLSLALDANDIPVISHSSLQEYNLWINHCGSRDCSLFTDDVDKDFVSDSVDNCLNLINTDQLDLDGDGEGDLCDTDMDGDGVPNDVDKFPEDPDEWADTDGDTIGDNSDNCPNVVNVTQADLDGDGIGDACDDDIDGDTFPNAEDAFPYDPAEWLDTDGDNIGNNADPDDDGDGWADDTELSCGSDPLNSLSGLDLNNLPLNCSPDADGDGVIDTEDAFPLDPTEWIDTDGDGVGNNSDSDDDGDGFTDVEELACGTDSLDPSSVLLNSDGDTDPNSRFDPPYYDCYDPDDDNDGVPDVDDFYPLDPTRWQQDSTPPVISVAVPVISAEATGAETHVDLGTVTAADAVDGTVSVSSNAPAAFPLGVTTVTYTASDSSGNTATATQTVTVVDTTAPSISVASQTINVEATAVESVVGLGSVTAVDLVDGLVTVSSDAPAAFPLGATTVTYTASDSNGNTATATQTVTVVDTTAPVITSVPADVNGIATGDTNTANLGELLATDIFDVSVSNDAPDTFPVGTTVVTWTATDANDNTTTATQQVTFSYQFAGFLSPLSSGGIYKTNRVLPIKFALTYTDGSLVTSARATLSLYRVGSDDVSGEGIEVYSSSAADSGNVFRTVGDGYIYNLDTGSLSEGIYRLVVNLDDGTSHAIDIAFK